MFCDVDPKTLTLDPDDVERRISERTRAICAAHVWGNPARLDRLVEIAGRHQIALIEDCSHAHGAVYGEKPVGSWGDIGCFSLQGQKPVSGGEAGIAVTDNAVLYVRMVALGHNVRSSTGQADGTFHINGMSFGLKYRPHVLAILLAHGGLTHLEELNRRRAANYQVLVETLTDCQSLQPIESCPGVVRGGFLEFIFRYEPQEDGGWNRSAFVKAAQAEGVPIEVDRYCRVGSESNLLHESPMFRDIDYAALGGHLGGGWQPSRSAPTKLPVAEGLREQLVTLPPFTKVPKKYLHDCAAAMRKIAEHARATVSHATTEAREVYRETVELASK